VNNFDILAILSPPDNTVKELTCRIQDPSIKSIRCAHIANAGGQQFPTWVVVFWNKLLSLRSTQMKWHTAHHEVISRLALKPDDNLLNQVLNALSYIPWTGQLIGFQNLIGIHNLWTFLSKEWLSDDHLLIMLDLLQEDVAIEYRNHILIENMHFMNVLTAVYNECTC
jgi:hypothetical protein